VTIALSKEADTSTMLGSPVSKAYKFQNVIFGQWLIGKLFQKAQETSHDRIVDELKFITI
jgi:hypothetical protein